MTMESLEREQVDFVRALVEQPDRAHTLALDLGEAGTDALCEKLVATSRLYMSAALALADANDALHPEAEAA
jgi:hypothetical protein